LNATGQQAASGGASSSEKVNYQRDDRKNQKEMNQEARDVEHNEASDPGKDQQCR
jgi:hypothetical protein